MQGKYDKNQLALDKPHSQPQPQPPFQLQGQGASSREFQPYRAHSDREIPFGKEISNFEIRRIYDVVREIALTCKKIRVKIDVNKLNFVSVEDFDNVCLLVSTIDEATETMERLCLDLQACPKLINPSDLIRKLPAFQAHKKTINLACCNEFLQLEDVNVNSSVVSALESVLQNIIDNAGTYSGQKAMEGEDRINKKIEIRATVKNNSIEIGILDNGDPADEKKLWRKNTADIVVTDIAPGKSWGLGFKLATENFEKSGGKVSYTYSPEKQEECKKEFTVSIPLQTLFTSVSQKIPEEERAVKVKDKFTSYAHDLKNNLTRLSQITFLQSSVASIIKKLEVIFPRTGFSEKAKQLIAERIEQKGIRSHENFTILVLDDDPFVRSTNATSLEKYNFSIIACPSAQDALEKIDQKKDTIDLVLTDIQMPGMDGYEFAIAVREKFKQFGCKCPTILAVNGDDSEETKRKVLAHMDGVIGKPLNISYIVPYFAGTPLALESENKLEIRKIDAEAEEAIVSTNEYLVLDSGARNRDNFAFFKRSVMSEGSISPEQSSRNNRGSILSENRNSILEQPSSRKKSIKVVDVEAKETTAEQSSCCRSDCNIF